MTPVKTFFFNWDHILNHWGLECQHNRFWENTIHATTHIIFYGSGPLTFCWMQPNSFYKTHSSVLVTLILSVSSLLNYFLLAVSDLACISIIAWYYFKFAEKDQNHMHIPLPPPEFGLLPQLVNLGYTDCQHRSQMARAETYIFPWCSLDPCHLPGIEMPCVCWVRCYQIWKKSQTFAVMHLIIAEELTPLINEPEFNGMFIHAEIWVLSKIYS